MLKSSHRKKPHGRGKTRIPLRIACFFTAVVLLAAVAGVSVSTAQEDYVLGPEDVISVTVWGHDDLTRELQISLDGTISFPLIGNITAEGQTTKSLEQDIAARLADGYIVGPQLTVSVTEYRSQKFFIFGEVTSPGKFDLEPGILESIMTVLDYIGRDIPVVFPVHPRTRLRLKERGNNPSSRSSLKLIEPLGYLDFLKLMAHARILMTDSGGIQEETTILGTPCLTLRENTERPVTVAMGTNRVVGSDPARILAACRAVMAETASPRNGGGNRCTPPLWDGRAAERIADIVLTYDRKKKYNQIHENDRMT